MARQIICDRCKEVIPNGPPIPLVLTCMDGKRPAGKDESTYELCDTCRKVFFSAMERPPGCVPVQSH